MAAASFATAASHAAAPELAPGSILIELRPDALAKAEVALLGDVASIRTSDLDAIRRLVQLPIGRAPRPGEQALVSQHDLARWVRRQVALPHERLVWAGADTVRVRAAATQVRAASVETVAREALRQWLSPRTTRFHADVVSAAPEITVPAGQVELKARPLNGDEPRSRAVVWVDVAVDGRFVRSVPVTFAVDVYREASVAPRRVEANALPAQQPIQAAEPVTQAQANTRAMAAVVRGDWVQVTYRAGAVELEGRAQALQEGQLGQLVQVKTAGAAGSIAARVVDAGRVEAVQ
ncbi:MAG TPA: flagella basal body P-ring formation protein FlgA [Ramlibacter sp.]|nr:flagella basal body P-ring formation protein FlgA [Ramlibacter sp.]